MDKKKLTELGMDALELATRVGAIKLKKYLEPYMITGVLLASWTGVLPRQRITVDKKFTCVVCHKKKSGSFLQINIPWSGEFVMFCQKCEEKEYKKMQGWFSKGRKR